MTSQTSAGARFRTLPSLQSIPAAGCRHHHRLCRRYGQRTGFNALYLSGGGVAANSLGMPDLGISTMEDVLTDIRRITDVCDLPLLVDVDTGWGGAFNIARTVRSLEQGRRGCACTSRTRSRRSVAATVPARRGLEDEMVDRIKAAVDARTDAAS